MCYNVSWSESLLKLEVSMVTHSQGTRDSNDNMFERSVELHYFAQNIRGFHPIIH